MSTWQLYNFAILRFYGYIVSHKTQYLGPCTNSTLKNLRFGRMHASLVKEIYLVSGKFPDEERFGITNQLRRAAAGIMANIAGAPKKHE